MDINKHVKNYLDFYCDNKNITPFAVLLKGKWGCGKTYFIKNSIKKQKGFFYISLYGIKTSKEIKERMIVELLPSVPRKYNKIIGSFYQKIKSIPAIKRWIPSDPDELIIDVFLKNKKNKIVFIFDDVERCNMPINNLFGYINHLVEFQNQKTILIANEEEILKSDDGEEYRKKKEKLIGKEFVVRPNTEEAIADFVKNIKDDNLKKHSDEIKKQLLEIFNLSKSDNLRLIQQALSYFEYLFKNIPPEIQENKEIFKKIFFEFIVIFIEYKKGEIKSDDFFKRYPQFFKGLEKEDEKKEHFLDKYGNNLSHRLTCFDVDILGKILQGASLTTVEQKKMIKKLKQLVGLDEESWQKLWRFEEYSDKDFFRNLKDVRNKWNDREYHDFFVVLHIFGMFIHFSEIGLIEKSKKEVLKEGKEYIDFLIENKKFPLDLKEKNIGFGWKDGAYGLGYSGMNTEEWRELLNFIDKRFSELRPEFIREKIKNELMPILRREKETNKSLDSLMNHDFIPNEAYFHYFNVNEMVNIICDNNSHFLYLFQDIFKKRYTSRINEISNIEKEINFLRNLKVKLEERIVKIEKQFKQRTPKSFSLRSFIKNAINPFIKTK